MTQGASPTTPGHARQRPELPRSGHTRSGYTLDAREQSLFATPATKAVPSVVYLAESHRRRRGQGDGLPVELGGSPPTAVSPSIGHGTDII